MNERELAELLHDHYEKVSREVSWETQKECQVSFEQLPERNKLVMLRQAKFILKIFIPKQELKEIIEESINPLLSHVKQRTMEESLLIAGFEKIKNLVGEQEK